MNTLILILSYLVLAECLFRLLTYVVLFAKKEKMYWLTVPLRKSPPAAISIKYASHPYIIYVKKPNVTMVSPLNKSATNNFGFEGTVPTSLAKPKGVVRIMCIGGSTTDMNVGDDPNNTYPHHLEDFLKKEFGNNIEVLNAGCAAYTSAESLINFELRMLEFKPDIAVVYHAVNDALWAGIQDGFKSDYSHARVNKEIKPNVWNKLPNLRWSFLYSYIRKKLMFGLGRPWGLIFYINKFPMKAAKQFDPQAVATFKRNITSICAVAKAHGILPVVVDFNYNPRLDRREPSHFLRGMNLLDAQEIYLKTLRGNIGVLKEVASELAGVVFCPIKGLEEKHYLPGDDCHFNEEGMKHFAAQISERLKPHVRTLLEEPLRRSKEGSVA